MNTLRDPHEACSSAMSDSTAPKLTVRRSVAEPSAKWHRPNPFRRHECWDLRAAVRTDFAFPIHKRRPIARSWCFWVQLPPQSLQRQLDIRRETSGHPWQRNVKCPGLYRIPVLREQPGDQIQQASRKQTLLNGKNVCISSTPFPKWLLASGDIGCAATHRL